MKVSKKEIFYVLFLAGLILLCISGCNKKDPSNLTVIPRPLLVTQGTGQFTISADTRIISDKENAGLRSVADYLAGQLRSVTGYALPVLEEVAAEAGNNAIILTTVETDPERGNESYSLICTPASILMQGDANGVFYAVQTLFQLLPPAIFSQQTVTGTVEWSVPAVTIEDKPRFQWRGMHLDVGRHLFPVAFIKRYLDYLAMHKFNIFHWHLTDDQGWRIEIKKYPRLTEIGAWRDGTVIGHAGNKPVQFDGERYGGYYTQDEIRQIVQYAADRFITVVPEIEMPGHSIAALTAYPELSCSGGPFEVRRIWGVEENIFCAGNEQVFGFLEDVLTEVIDLFPSNYIHIGGDEAPKKNWQACPKCQKRIKDENLGDEQGLQSYFIGRIETFMNSKGRQIIGWDEILEGGLAPNAAVMSWRGTEGGIAAAKLKHNVVMTPTNYCYFDYYQSDPNLEPLAIGGYLPLEKVYEYEPIPEELTIEEQKYILGAQGNVWTEYIKTPEIAEYMAIPRMCALADVVWSDKKHKDLEDFLTRMTMHYNRLDAAGINYYWPSVSGFSSNNVFVDKILVELKNQRSGSDIRYTLDGSEPGQTSERYSGPLLFTETTTLSVKEFMPSGKTSRVYSGKFEKRTLLDPVQVDAAKKGIQYMYFALDEPVQSTRELENMKPDDSGRMTHISFPDKDLPEYFGLIFTGYLRVPRDGIYTFYTESNDGSCLYMADQLVVNNDGSHGAMERAGQAALKAGLHPIRVTYFQEGGSKALKVSLKGPGIDKTEIQEEILNVAD